MEPSDFLLHRKNTFLTVAGYCIFFQFLLINKLSLLVIPCLS